MSEALEAVQDFLFFDLGEDEILVSNDERNLGSRRLKEKYGATYLKTIDDETQSGKSKVQIWRLTKQQWINYRNKNFTNPATPYHCGE